jgi:hypothetical protein
LNGQIALPTTEDEHLDITALENEARPHEELFWAMLEVLMSGGLRTTGLLPGTKKRLNLV